MSLRPCFATRFARYIAAVQPLTCNDLLHWTKLAVHCVGTDNQPAMDAFTIYVALWERAQEQGASVHYEDGPEDGGLNGYFESNRHEASSRPEIVIVRHSCIPPLDEPRRESAAAMQPDILNELITLSHEYGHFSSFRTTPTWAAYEDASARMQSVVREIDFAAIINGQSMDVRIELLRRALQERLAAAERQLILEEEQRAWTIAQETLSRMGYDDWPRFLARQERGLHFHSSRLGETLP